MLRTRYVMFTAACAAALLSSPAHAQSRVQVGMLAGTNLATLTDMAGSVSDPTDALKAKYRAGFQGGLFATIPVRGRLSLQPEVHYVQKGSTFEGQLSGADLSGDVGVALKLGYIDIPLLARLELGRSTGVHPFVIFGPAVAIRTACTVSMTVQQVTLNTSCSDAGDDASSGSLDPVRKSDISGIAGVGLGGTLMGRAASVQLRFSQSVRSIANDDATGGSSIVSPKNRGFSVVFGLTR